MKTSTISTLIALLASVDAHGGVWKYTIGGQDYQGYQWYTPDADNKTTIQRRWEVLSPLYDPLSPYMADCEGPCEDFNATGPEVWFKIEERGLENGTYLDGYWGMQVLTTGETWNTTIPNSLKPGNYLIRHELLAIHQPPTQIYMECAQLKVTGSGTNSPGAEYKVAFPGAYPPNLDVPHLFTSDANRTVYDIPGPKVWTG